MNSATEERSRTLSGSLRQLFGTGLGILQNRVELLSVEWQEEKFRIVELIAGVAAMTVFGLMTLLTFTLTVVFAVPRGARLPVSFGFCVIYALAVFLFYRWLQRKLSSGPPPFAATVEELKKDRACLEEMHSND